MLGAIAGDIVGSPWENGRCAPENFTLFGEDCVFTDDTVCSIAIADALLEGDSFTRCLRHWAKSYPGRGYGGGFIDWVHEPDKVAYGSLMNGGAMRVSATAWLADDIDDCLALAKASAIVTHNHPEGIEGAQAIAAAVWFGRQGNRHADLLAAVQPYVSYDLTRTPEDFDGVTTHARESVPAAIIAAAYAHDWVDAVRLTCAIGGDCDTTSCMAGAIAEACYGLPVDVARAAIAYLPPEMFEVVKNLYAAADQDPPWEAVGGYEVPSLFAKLRGWLQRRG